MRTQYFEALARDKLIRGAVEEQKTQANQLSEGAIEYSLLKRDAETNRQLYQKLKEAGVSAGMLSSNIEVVDVAEVPAGPSESNIPRNLVVTALLGIVGGIGLASFRRKLTGRFAVFITFKSFHRSRTSESSFWRVGTDHNWRGAATQLGLISISWRFRRSGRKLGSNVADC